MKRRPMLILSAAIATLAVVLAVSLGFVQQAGTGEAGTPTAAGTELPAGYTEPIENSGTVSAFEYPATSGSNGTVTKRATLYLPYGYDPADESTKYNVLYLLHGGGGNEQTWLGTPQNPAGMARVLDHMIADGTIPPLLVVAPTFNTSPEPFNQNVPGFLEELTTDLIPAFEGSHRTYATDFSPDGLTGSRDHRAFGGFSMGAVTTWHVLENAMAYFAGFMPLSGDSWATGQFGGRNNPAATAEALAAAVDRSGYTAEDYVLFAATGTEDIAYENMRNQIAAMSELSDTFRFADDGCRPGTATFHVTPGNLHDYSAATEYAYLGLPCLFQEAANG